MTTQRGPLRLRRDSFERLNSGCHHAPRGLLSIERHVVPLRVIARIIIGHLQCCVRVFKDFSKGGATMISVRDAEGRRTCAPIVRA